MSNEIIHAIEQVGREKGIELDVIIHAVEDAYAAAAKKYFRTKEELGARFDRDSGVFDVFARKKVVEEVTNPDLEISPGEAQGMDLPLNEEGVVEILKPRGELTHLGRIAAQAAKQIIFQKVREAERDNIFKEYADRLGEMINGVVKRFERGNIIVDLGRTEGILPKKEQSKAERYSQGDRIRAVIVDVDSNAKGPQVVISRTDERLLVKLFEMEVPEIYDGTVMIERAVRDPGDRAKVAVRSKDRDVDPVGACVGMKGSRVQSIIRELRGEKIDIVQYSEELNSFVTNSLNPAKVNRVQILDPENKALEVVVDDEQLSLAIGKKGQNVRLASRLAGWRIDIKSEQDKRREIEAEMERRATEVREVEGLEAIAEKTIERLLEAGLRSIDVILEADVAGLTEVPGIGTKGAEKILAAAQAMLDTRPEREAEAARLLAEEEARAAEDEAAALAAQQEAELAAQAEAELQNPQEDDQQQEQQEYETADQQEGEVADQQEVSAELEGGAPAEALEEAEPAEATTEAAALQEQEADWPTETPPESEQRLEAPDEMPAQDSTPDQEDPAAPESDTDGDEERRKES
jgi:N utilization substance protein A